MDSFNRLSWPGPRTRVACLCSQYKPTFRMSCQLLLSSRPNLTVTLVITSFCPTSECKKKGSSDSESICTMSLRQCYQIHPDPWSHVVAGGTALPDFRFQEAQVGPRRRGPSDHLPAGTSWASPDALLLLSPALSSFIPTQPVCLFASFGSTSPSPPTSGMGGRNHNTS